MQGYHFPPPEPQPGYGYSNPQLLATQQWGQNGGDQQGYELNYQAYSHADPGPFQHGAHYQHQGYDTDGDYTDDLYEDEEPRRGRRWILIVAALVGAIGVGGALAYTYRSLIAPHSGRVPWSKTDPNAKLKADQRGGAERRMPTRSAEDLAPSRTAEATPQDESPAENLGPRAVKTIPITPGGAPPPAPVAAPAIPGLTIYQPPQAPMPAPAPAAAPPPQVAPPKVVQPPPSSRVTVGSRLPPSETDDDPPLAARRPPIQTAAVAPKAPPPRASTSSGLGFVAVLSSQKTSMDALKIFADLQQRYGDVLGDKAPDVQEVDLSERGLGMMYRLVVGPPGSKNAAQGVCAQLKAAGYVGCWVKEY